MQVFKHHFVNILLIGLFILIFNPISAQSHDENSDSRQTIVYVGFYIKSIMNHFNIKTTILLSNFNIFLFKDEGQRLPKISGAEEVNMMI